MTHYDEYHAARTGAALRDAQTSFRLYMRGADHLDFLHRMTSNDFHNLQLGHGCEAVFIEQRARILDLATCYRGPDTTVLILSPDSRAAILAWLDRFIFAEALELADRTRRDGHVRAYRPTRRPASRPPIGRGSGKISGSPTARSTGCGRPVAGAHGRARAARLRATRRRGGLWQRLTAAGAHPIGAATWEILRVEQGLPLLGRELTQDYNPWEAGLDRAIHLDKGCYIGQEVIARLDTYDKVKQHLVGLRLSDAELPAAGQPLRDGAREVGRITSAVHSPSLGPIALAYVRRSACAEGTALDVDGAQATVVSLPFSSHENR